MFKLFYFGERFSPTPTFKFRLSNLFIYLLLSLLLVCWLVRQNRSFQNDSSSEGFLHMNEIIGAKVKRFRKEGQTEEKSGICLGLDVYVANLSSDSIHYAVDVILFAHPSHEITNRWCQRIDQLLGRFISH